MTFWAALKESFLEWFYGGTWKLEQMRKEDRIRKECELIIKKHRALAQQRHDNSIDGVRR